MFYVYILECSDGTYYTGYTTDVERRIRTHNKGKGAKYTRGRLPVKLVYSESLDSKSLALRREWYIKRLSRQQKINLIRK
jgi:putative endonuclease